MSFKSLKLDLEFAKNFCLAFGLIAFISLFISDFALAATDSDAAAGGAIGQVLCNVVKAIQGTIGKAVATIGIVALGIGLFAGKLNWPVAIATAIGIGLIFGAASIMEFITSTTDVQAGGATTLCQ